MAASKSGDNGARPWWWVRTDERARAHRIGTDVEAVHAERTRSAWRRS